MVSTSLLTIYRQRITALQTTLTQQGWDALVLPSADPHLNEYLPPAYKRRDWLTGFTGSAGDVLVTPTQCFVFADGRYHEQADLEVPTDVVTVQKIGLSDALTLNEQMKQLANTHAEQRPSTPWRLVFDATLHTHTQVEGWQKLLASLPVELTPLSLTEPHPIDALQRSFGEAPEAFEHRPIRSMPVEHCGRSMADKLTWLLEKTQAVGCDGVILCKLDDVAWLLNLRGQDIPYNPVFYSYVLVLPNALHVFASLEHIPQHLLENTLPEGWRLHRYAYDTFYATVATLIPAQQTVATHGGSTPHAVVQALGKQAQTQHSYWVQQEKAIKTEAERHGMRQANALASLAVADTLAWLREQYRTSTPTTEADLANYIEQRYRHYGAFDLSFNTIAGAGAASSIIHYSTPDAQRPLQPDDWVLLDSGAQFEFGTTDLTRTVVFGQTAPTPEHRRAYTAVLKGVIQTFLTPFPKGTTGAQMDGVCRGSLFQLGYDYAHGTGHGVGHALNVHEGPNGISKVYNQPIALYSINSIEPGYYRAGWGGIRLENLAVVALAEHHPRSEGTPKGDWYHYDTLSWVPFEPTLIDTDLLTPTEQAWLQEYHRSCVAVLKQISPTPLEPRTEQWLQEVHSGVQ
ncbi:MAG: M24 family metallopeptidase [Vampirovibrionales bacterium]